jgi:hypothetical protein
METSSDVRPGPAQRGGPVFLGRMSLMGHTRNTQTEPMFFALPLKAAIGADIDFVRSVPRAAVSRCSKQRYSNCGIAADLPSIDNV